MARIAPGLTVREWSLAGAFGLYLTAAPLGAVALVAAPTAADLVRVPIYAALGMLVGFVHDRRTRRRTAPKGRPAARTLVVTHAIALPCALSFLKVHDLDWDRPHLGGVLFLGASITVLWRAVIKRRVARQRAAPANATRIPSR